MMVLDEAEPSPLGMGAVLLEGLSFLEWEVLAVEALPEPLPLSLGWVIVFAASFLEMSMRIFIFSAILF